jgi:hypothetical protein
MIGVCSRKGYMGYVYQIATMIEKDAEEITPIAEKLESSAEWKQFVELELSPTKRIIDPSSVPATSTTIANVEAAVDDTDSSESADDDAEEQRTAGMDVAVENEAEVTEECEEIASDASIPVETVLAEEESQMVVQEPATDEQADAATADADAATADADAADADAASE